MPAEPEAAADEAWCNGQWPANTCKEEGAYGGQRPTRTEGGGEEDTCFDEVIGIATTKRAMSGIDVLDVDSSSMSEMSLSSRREAAAAQGLPPGVPMLKR